MLPFSRFYQAYLGLFASEASKTVPPIQDVDGPGVTPGKVPTDTGDALAVTDDGGPSVIIGDGFCCNCL